MSIEQECDEEFVRFERAGERKTCTNCNKNKPIGQFYKRKGTAGRTRSWCKQCYSDAAAERWARDGDFRKRQNKRSRKYMLRTLYGLSTEEYNGKLEQQGGVCAICGNPPKNERRCLAVDHCHDTDKIRDLLCNPCNSMLGHCRESIATLKSAIAYLEKWNDNSDN